MSNVLGVHHVNLTIEVGDEAFKKASRFFEEVLGLRRLPRPENIDNGRPGLWLALGDSGQQIHLSAEPQAESFNGPSGRHFAMQVQDIEVLRARLKEASVNIEEANKFPGQHRCFCRDPFGNRIEFVQFVQE